MSDVRVTKQFKDDFDTWAEDRLRNGDFTAEEMDEMKSMIRIELKPGPDQLRQGVEAINAAGVVVPVTIDSNEERYKVWSNYFSAEAKDIKSRARKIA